MNEQSNEKKGVLKEYLGVVNKYAPAASLLILCLMLGFFAGSNENHSESRDYSSYEVLNPKYSNYSISQKEYLKNQNDLALEENNIERLSKLDKYIAEIIWDKELATPKDLLKYAVKENDQKLCDYIIDKLTDDDDLIMNFEGVKKFKENKLNYKKELLEDLSKTDAAERKYAETVKELSNAEKVH